MDKKQYVKMVEKEKKKMIDRKAKWYAFLYGGSIGAFGQFLLETYQTMFHLDFNQASTYMTLTMIFIASLLTALGYFDKIAHYAGTGTLIPITGFANSLTSSAIESRSEGLILGIGSNMFKLGGTVITYGVVSSTVLGGIIYVFNAFF